MNKSVKKPVHSGHRERMMKKYDKLGADAFEPHELLEMLLYYSIRRKNTNEIAHNFIDEFGSVSNVFSAKADAMTQVKGIGAASAHLIELARDVSRCCELEHSSSIPLDSDFKIKRYIYNWYRGKSAGVVMAMFLSEDRKLIETEILSAGRRFRPDSYPEVILEKALSTSAKYVIISHNHSNNSSTPSPEDLWLGGYIRSSLGKNGITLIDQYIVTEFDVVATSNYNE